MRDVVARAFAIGGLLLLVGGVIWGWAFLTLRLWSVGWYPVAAILASIPFLLAAAAISKIGD